MKSKLILTTILLVAGVSSTLYFDERRESQHREEYAHHVTKAFSGVELADQNAQMILENWENRTPQEITSSLLAISSVLIVAENEMSNLEGYLRYHDDSSSGGSTAFLSHLFQFYQQAADARLRGTWQSMNLPTHDHANEKQLLSLRRDIESLQKDLHHLTKIDKTIFERASLTELHEYWFQQITSLQFKEVTQRYEEFEGVRPPK